MKQFDITGMSCAACSARVEKAVSKLEGIESCSVNLLTNSMAVSGTATDQEIVAAVQDAGYGARLKGDSAAKPKDAPDTVQMEISQMKKRLFFSLGFLIVLMYLSMGHTMLSLPLPSFLEGNHVAIALWQMLLAAVVMVINQKFFINGFKGAIHRAPNMDTLVALGSAASFVYSVYGVFMMTANTQNAMHHLHDLYFESAAMILVLITFGKLLEAFAKGKTTNALKALAKLAPKTVTILRGDEEVLIPIEELKVGDVFVVRPGESLAADGVVIAGDSAVTEAALTGESLPVDKTVGDTVSAATINTSGVLKCRAEKVGADTTLSKIIQMVSDASATKAPIAKIADKVSGVFVPVVIAIALVTLLVWLVLGREFGFALARGISVLVISCPCALGLATPVAIMVGNGIGAKNGILFKTAESLEKMGRIDVVALDKTGTITLGQPKVTDIIPNGVTEDELLQLAYSLEYHSEHPLAKAIIAYGNEHSMKMQSISNFAALSGSGLKGTLDGETVYGGSFAFISTIAQIPEDKKAEIAALSDSGKTPLLFTRGKEFIGIIAVADTIKDDSVKAIETLKNLGCYVVMLTGDNQRTAKAIGDLVGVQEVVSGVLPEGKADVIARLKEKGKVAMVGDGINDALALTTADVGVAIGAGTDVAIDASEVVLVNNKLEDVVGAIRLSRGTIKTIHQNLFWAFFYNAICIPIAAGVFTWVGLVLNPMFGAAAMSVSSVFVVTNALRLNLIDIRSNKKDKKIKPHKAKEEKPMQKTMKIEGMMCSHCEARVKKTLEALPQVDEAIVSHREGTAVVILNKDIEDSELKSVIEAQDYQVISVQ